MSKIEELKMYRNIIEDINDLYKISEENRLYEEAANYLDNSANEKFYVENDRPKVKILRLYR